MSSLPKIRVRICDCPNLELMVVEIGKAMVRIAIDARDNFDSYLEQRVLRGKE